MNGRISYTAAIRRINKAVKLAVKYGGIDGDHHKDWVIDQIVRTLCAGEYNSVVASARAGVDGPETYEWNVGIAP